MPGACNSEQTGEIDVYIDQNESVEELPQNSENWIAAAAENSENTVYKVLHLSVCTMPFCVLDRKEPYGSYSNPAKRNFIIQTGALIVFVFHREFGKKNLEYFQESLLIFSKKKKGVVESKRVVILGRMRGGKTRLLTLLEEESSKSTKYNLHHRIKLPHSL